MPKKNQEDIDKEARRKTKDRIVRTENYAERVRLLFATCVNEILALKKELPKLQEGEMYSFDGESVAVQRKVETLFRKLAAAATLAIENGIKVEWEKANKDIDEMLESVYSQKVLDNKEMQGWFEVNKEAMESFAKHGSNGDFKISDRIWKATRQLRDEMEVAITLGIGEGESAAEMSRKVRQYLNDPELMFRRFRYKGEDGLWHYKWKKKERDANGKVHWVDCDKDSYKTGKGVYKSSAKNAMRVTRTETNNAYRRAEQERWKDMDAVRGIRIQLSKSHPKEDICNKLAGDYPKTFVWEGWHPQCFCVQTPILVSDEDMLGEIDAMLDGEEFTPSTPEVTDFPQNFIDHVKENAENIEDEDRKQPYYIDHNKEAVNDILHEEAKPKEGNEAETPKKPSALDKARKRHAERTETERKRIVDAWNERKKRIKREAERANKNKSDIKEAENETKHPKKAKVVRKADSIDKETLKEREDLYNELSNDENYIDVEFNKENGGVKATHKGHFSKGENDERFFGDERLTASDLENECQNNIFRLGGTAILLDESKKIKGFYVTSLDLEMNAIKMDIRAIVGNGWYSNAFLIKNEQLHRYLKREDINEDVDSLCLYFHDKTMFNEEKMNKSIEYFKEHPCKEGKNIKRHIKHIYCIINKEDYYYVYDL